MLLEVLIEQSLVAFHHGFVFYPERRPFSSLRALLLTHADNGAGINEFPVVLVVFAAVSGLYGGEETFVVHTDVADKALLDFSSENNIRIIITDKTDGGVTLEAVVEVRRKRYAATPTQVIAHLTILSHRRSLTAPQIPLFLISLRISVFAQWLVVLFHLQISSLLYCYTLAIAIGFK